MSTKRLVLVILAVIGVCLNPIPVLAQDFGFMDWFWESEDYYEEEYGGYPGYDYGYDPGSYEPYGYYDYGSPLVIGFVCR